MAGTISATTAALIAAAVGAAGVGTGLYESHESGVNQDKALKAQQLATQQAQQAQANQANLAKQEAVLGAQGQTQQQTGGSLTDSGTAALTSLLAGYPGYQAGQTGSTGGAGTGTPSSGVSGSSPNAGTGTPDVAAILAALRNGGGSGAPGAGSSSTISGGNWQTQPATPQQSFELANPVIG